MKRSGFIQLAFEITTSAEDAGPIVRPMEMCRLQLQMSEGSKMPEHRTSWPIFILAASFLASASRSEVSQPTPVKVPPRIAAFLKQCESSRRGSILQLEHTLRGLRSESTLASDRARRIAQVEEDLRVLKANERPFVPPLHFPPEIGAIGRLPRLSGHVMEVLGAEEMLVRCLFPVKVTSVRNFQGTAETIFRPVTFLVRGVPTSEIHEGADTELVQVFEISGRQMYQNGNSTLNSVLVMNPFDMTAIESFFRDFHE